MKVVGKEMREVEFIEDVLCNRCGKSCRPEGVPGDSGDFYGLIEASFSTGYFSPALPDTRTYTFSLCEPCVKVIMEDFKIPAEDREVNFG